MSLPALYKLADQYRGLLSLDAEDVPEEVIRDTLEALAGDIHEKSMNVAAYCRNLESAADAIDGAAKQMKERAAKVRKRADSIRAYLLSNMQACEVTRIECPYFTISVKKNPPSVVVYDEAAIPDDLMAQPPPHPDKARIKERIKSGKGVPGCKLESGVRLDIK